MVVLKLKRIGKKHQASFRIVVAERRSKADGMCIEDLGYYNPHTKNSAVKKDRVEHWIKNGAQMTDSVNNILVNNKTIEGSVITKKINHKRGKKDNK